MVSKPTGIPRKNANSIVLDTGLNTMKTKFIWEYVVDMNPAKAAVRAGYKESNAALVGKHLLAEELVQKEVAKLLELRRNEHKTTEKKIIDELASIAFFDPLSVYDSEGNVRPLDELDASIRRVIVGVEKRVVGKRKNQKEITKYDIADKMRALELLGKYLALFTDKVDISGKVDFKRMSDDDLNRFILDAAAQSGIGLIIDGKAETVSTAEDK